MDAAFAAMILREMHGLPAENRPYLLIDAEMLDADGNRIARTLAVAETALGMMGAVSTVFESTDKLLVGIASDIRLNIRYIDEDEKAKYEAQAIAESETIGDKEQVELYIRDK